MYNPLEENDYDKINKIDLAYQYVDVVNAWDEYEKALGVDMSVMGEDDE